MTKNKKPKELKVVCHPEFQKDMAKLCGVKIKTDGTGYTSFEELMEEIRKEERIWYNRYFLGPIHSFLCKIQSLLREQKFKLQRLSKGYSDNEVWDLGFSTLDFLNPRLKELRKHHWGHPCGLTEKKWNDILDELIWLTEHVDEEWDLGAEEQKEYYIRQKKACKLLGKYLLSLWD